MHPPLTVSQMATTAGVSERSIQHAKQVEESGSAALKAAVKVGDVSISTAAKIAQLPKKDQAAAIVAPPEPQYTPLDAAHDQIGELQSALAVANIEGSEKDKDQAKDLITTLRAEIKTLTETLKAVTISRDTLQNELAAMKRHNISLQKKLDKK